MKIEVGPEKKLTIDGVAAGGHHLQVVKRSSGTHIILDDQEVTEACEVWMHGMLFASNAQEHLERGDEPDA